MKKINKKLISFILASSVVAGFASVPAFAADQEMTVSAPKYYRVDQAKIDGVGNDVLDEVEAPVNGKFTDILTWGTDNNYGTITGDFKTEVNISNGSGKDATLLAAVFDSEDRLVNVVSDKKVKEQSEDTLSVTAAIGENETFKAFVWENESTLKPLAVEGKAPVISYFYCDDPGTVTIAWFNEGGNYSVYKNGEEVVDPELATYGVGGWNNMGKYSAFAYIDTDAEDGDTYVIKDNGVSSEALVADFEDGAYITMGRYVVGRNMAYMRNDNAQWWHNSVSDHRNIEGRDCDVAAYKSFYANNKNNEKWTNFFFKLDQDYISGSGNAVDVTINYFDIGNDTVRLQYFPDSNPSAQTQVVVAQLEDTKTWKTATYRLTGASFLADTELDGDYQIRVLTGTGSAISGVSVAPYINTNISTLRAANVYTDGVELRWTMESETGVTGYTIKRDGEIIATNYQRRVYYDRNLDAGTEYSYTVTPELAKGVGVESEACVTKTAKAQKVSMTLPLTDAPNSISETQEYTENGLTFALNNNNRYRDVMTLNTTYGGAACRSTVAQNRKKEQYGGINWYDISTWNKTSDGSGNLRNYLTSSYLTFRVDNSVISADTRDITIEFDFYDNNVDLLNGSNLQLKYAKAASDGKTEEGSKTSHLYSSSTGTNTWKTATFTLTDAQFDHSLATDAFKYDFRIGATNGRGGVAVRNIKVYKSTAATMPEHEATLELNADGTAFVGDLGFGSTINGGYDKGIGLSGLNGLSQVDGKHYSYNIENKNLPSGEGWKQWKNAWIINIPDSMLSGTNYEKVEIEVEYYVPDTKGGTLDFYVNADSTRYTTTVPGGRWGTKVFTVTKDDGKNATFSNGYGTGDIKFVGDRQFYISKITVRKDIIED